MFDVSIDNKDIIKAINGLKQMDSQFISTIDKAVGTTVAEGNRTIIEKTPKITGNLRRGFQIAHLGQTIWQIFNVVVYAPFIEEGERLVRAHSNLKTKKTFGSRIIKRKAGPAHMVKNSLAHIQKRLEDNIDTALTLITKWRNA